VRADKRNADNQSVPHALDACSCSRPYSFARKSSEYATSHLRSGGKLAPSVQRMRVGSGPARGRVRPFGGGWVRLVVSD